VCREATQRGQRVQGQTMVAVLVVVGEEEEGSSEEEVYPAQRPCMGSEQRAQSTHGREWMLDLPRPQKQM